MNNNTDLEQRKQILTNIFYDFVELGFVKTWKEFAALMHVDKTTMSNAKNGNPQYLTENFIDKVMKLAERYTAHGGSAINSPHALVVNGDGNNIKQAEEQPQPGEPAQIVSATTLVPTIPYKAYTEIDTDLRDYVTDPKEKLHYSPAIAQFSNTDFHCFVNSDAMKPHLHPNDVLALKRVPDSAQIVNGEIYIINSKYSGLLARFVYDLGNELLLRAAPEQTRYTEMTMPKADVFGLYRILGLVRTNI